MGTGFGYESDTKSYVDLETKEVATKAIRDEMLSVDSNGKIIDGSANQQIQIGEKEERREKWSQSYLLILLTTIIFTLLMIVFYLNARDLKLIYAGNAIEVNCKEGTTITGSYHGEQVEAQYLDNYGRAKLTFMSKSGSSISEMVIFKGCVLKDGNDNVYLISLSKTLFSQSINKKITVYYDGNSMADARTLTSIWLWIGLYCLLIPLLVLFIKSIYKIFHKTNHSLLQ